MGALDMDEKRRVKAHRALLCGGLTPGRYLPERTQHGESVGKQARKSKKNRKCPQRGKTSSSEESSDEYSSSEEEFLLLCRAVKRDVKKTGDPSFFPEEVVDKFLDHGKEEREEQPPKETLKRKRGEEQIDSPLTAAVGRHLTDVVGHHMEEESLNTTIYAFKRSCKKQEKAIRANAENSSEGVDGKCVYFRKTWCTTTVEISSSIRRAAQRTHVPADNISHGLNKKDVYTLWAMMTCSLVRET